MIKHWLSARSAHAELGFLIWNLPAKQLITPITQIRTRPQRGISPNGDLPKVTVSELGLSLQTPGLSPRGSLLPPLPTPQHLSLLPRPLADFLAHEAQLVVTIGNVRGVLDTSILDPEPGPQGPFTSYSYYVTYDFVEDEEGEGHEYGGVLAEVRPGLVLRIWDGGSGVPGVPRTGRPAP